MLKRLFRPKTLKLIEKEQDVLRYEFEILRRFLAILHNNLSLCMQLQNFSIQPDKLRDFFKSLINIAKELQVVDAKDESIELKSIKILKKIDSEDVNPVKEFLKEKERLLHELITLDKDLKKYSRSIVTKNTKKIRDLIAKLTALFVKYQHAVHAILEILDEKQKKIEVIKDRLYRRVMGVDEYKRVKKRLVLGNGKELVPVFIFNRMISNLFYDFKNKRSHDRLEQMFRNIGTRAVQKIIIFKLDPGQDFKVLSDCPESQPQKVAGIIEQKLPGLIKIKILYEETF